MHGLVIYYQASPPTYNSDNPVETQTYHELLLEAVRRGVESLEVVGQLRHTDWFLDGDVGILGLAVLTGVGGDSLRGRGGRLHHCSREQEAQDG